MFLEQITKFYVVFQGETGVLLTPYELNARQKVENNAGLELVTVSSEHKAFRLLMEEYIGNLEAAKGLFGKDLAFAEKFKNTPVASSPAPPRSATTSPAAQTGQGEIESQGPGKDKDRREWDADPNLQAEFGNFEAFAAYRRAEAAGRVKICQRRWLSVAPL